MKSEGKIVETGTEQCRKRMEIIEAGDNKEGKSGGEGST